ETRAGIQCPDDVCNDRGDGLAGEKERTAQPESGAGEDNGDVAEVEEVPRAPDRGVGGHPNRKPGYRGPAELRERARIRGGDQPAHTRGQDGGKEGISHASATGI